MKKTLLALVAGALTLAGCTATPESEVEYDRALAAGYKALFLCSAIATSERAGATRSEKHIRSWELTGIYPALDPIVRNLPHTIVRRAEQNNVLDHVSVDWGEGEVPRIAYHQEGGGCSVAPMGMAEPPARATLPKTYPDGQFVTSDAPMDEALSAVFDQAFAKHYGAGARTTAVIVGGKEGDGVWRYADGFGPATPQRTWSVAKSMAATLVGAAVQNGVADVNASAGIGLNENDPRRAITIDHLLRMASGRYSDTPGNRTDPIYWGGATVGERAGSWPLVHEPGTVMRYANNDTLMAIEAIEDSFEAAPPSAFFAKVGMDHTIAETDWAGNYVLSSQVWSTAPDFLRLGQLYLNDGVWNGERLLPEGWLDYVSAPSGPQRSEGSYGYGASFWLMNNHPGVPKDTIAARGNRGQFIVIVPSRDVVIVRRGEDLAGVEGFNLERFTADVLAALDE